MSDNNELEDLETQNADDVKGGVGQGFNVTVNDTTISGDVNASTSGASASVGNLNAGAGASSSGASAGVGNASAALGLGEGVDADIQTS